MAQTTHLAAAQTALTSTDIVVAAGSTVTIGLFTDRAGDAIPAALEFWLMLDTPSVDNEVIDLAKVEGNARAVTGPGTYRVIRPLCTAFGVNVGVFSET